MPKYDISTLMALRHQAHFDVGRLSVHALNNNLLRQHRPPMRILVEEPVNRRKLSSFSRQSEDIFAGGFQPLRLPNDPPDSALAQTNAGFARFLKEHTSPKHQRVTAGGRIVPMEPQTPVPKFRLTRRKQTSFEGDHCDDLRALTRDDDRNSQLESGDSPTVDDGPEPADSTSSASARLLPDIARSSFMQGPEAYADRFGMPGLLPPVAANAGAFLQQHAIPFACNTGQFPYNAEAHASSLPPDYPAYGFGMEGVSCFPTSYQPMPAQNPNAAGQTHIQQPPSAPRLSEATSSSNMSASSASSCSQFSSGFDTRPCLLPQWQWHTGGPLPAFNPPHAYPATYRENSYQSRLKEVRGQYEILSSQLNRIDRHMALNAWDIDGHSKTLLVEQRKSLVRELDVLRLYIEQLEQILEAAKWGIGDTTAAAATTVGTSTPMGDPYAQLLGPRTPVPNPIYGMQSIPASPFPSTCPGFFSASDSTGAMLPMQGIDNSAFFGSCAQEGTPAAGECKQRARPQRRLTVKVSDVPGEISQAPTCEGLTGEVGTDGNRWATPVRSSPPDLQKIYHRIEEANKRGDKIDGLLQELSAATSELLSRRSEEAKKSTLATSGQGTRTLPSRAATGATGRVGENVEPYIRRLRHGRRPWASEFYPREHSNTHGSMSFGEAEPEGNMSSSCLSTNDPWATIHEADIPRAGTESLQSGSKGTHNSESWERSRETSHASITSIKSSGLQLPSAAGWHGRLVDNSPSKASVHRPLHEPSSVTNVSGGQGSKPVYPLFLPQPFHRGHGHMSQKTPALAVSQRVNAHACLDSKTIGDGALQSSKRPQGKRLWYRP